jgi:thiol-disulfide isomerase/thioredoxin
MRDPAASPSFFQSPRGFASQHRVCRACRFILGLLLAAVLLCSGHARGENRVQVPLADDFDLQVQQFPAAGRRLLIWLPSKYGIRAGNTWFAHTVQAAGIDYWLVDLHASYQAPTGRYGYANFEPRHVAQLIGHAVQQGWQHIVLGGESRGGRLAMQAARQWQLQHPGQTQLRGLLLFHPHLIFGNTPIGEKADLRPIVQATNLPAYILQPELNMKYLYSKALLNQLEAAGAPVYFHFLEDVRGGFHVRDADRITPTEAVQRERLGQTIRFALQRLADLPLPARAAQPPPATSTQRERHSTTDLPLVPLDNRAAPSLALADARGKKVHLEEFRGEVVLVNFWATWCGPCIREIGSLSRLNQAFADRPFRLLAVNISETEAHVERFFDQLGIEPEFEVLYDPTGAAARTWDIYTIPSTYLVDKQQRLRFGYRGALEWDRADVVELIRELTD